MDSTERVNDEPRELVRRCLGGDDQAQRELIKRHAGLCHAVASRILGPGALSYVEDAVQEAFYAVFAKLDQWQGQNLPAWIGTIAARRAIDLRRRLQRSLPEGALAFAADRASSRRESGPDLSELRETLEQARRTMTERQRAILDAILAGHTRGQVAGELGVSVRTVHYDLEAIRGLLKNLVQPRGPQSV